MSHHLSYDEAVALVAADVRESYPEFSYREAVDYVVETVALDSVYGDGQLEDAYRVVLARHKLPTFHDLVELVRVLSDEGVVQLSVVQCVWVDCVRQGVPLV